LRARKLWLTGRLDLPLDGAAILYAHDKLDRQQFDTLGHITLLLRRISRGWGGDGGCTGRWSALTGASIPTRAAPAALAQRMGVAEHARRQLGRILRQLDGSRALVIALAEGEAPPIVRRLINDRSTPDDSVTFEILRHGLDRISGGPSRRERADLTWQTGPRRTSFGSWTEPWDRVKTLVYPFDIKGYAAEADAGDRHPCGSITRQRCRAANACSIPRGIG
jgi:hypothetical protein